MSTTNWMRWPVCLHATRIYKACDTRIYACSEHILFTFSCPKFDWINNSHHKLQCIMWGEQTVNYLNGGQRNSKRSMGWGEEYKLDLDRVCCWELILAANMYQCLWGFFFEEYATKSLNFIHVFYFFPNFSPIITFFDHLQTLKPCWGVFLFKILYIKSPFTFVEC